MDVWFSVKLYHRFLRKEAVCSQPSHEVDRKVRDRSVSGVFNLGDVLEFIIYGLDDSPLSQQNLVVHIHQSALHVVPELCYQLDSIGEEATEQVLADVSLVTDKLAEEVVNEGLVPERLSVIHIAGSHHETQQLALFVAYKMELEPIEPSH